MSSTKLFFSSTVGRKVVMAITGVALYGFVVAHLLGNLQVFAGPGAFNNYAAFLKSIPGPLNMARIVLLGAFLLHMAMAFSLWRTNTSARPQPYKQMGTVQATAPSLYMMETGIVVLLFVLVHLLHFTFGALQPEYYELTDPQGRHDVYSMLVRGFQNPLYSIGYIGCMVLLGVHLSHGFYSLFQTLGFANKQTAPILFTTGRVLAIVIATGYILIPVAVLLGIITLPTGGA